jgi:uncharacterized protein
MMDDLGGSLAEEPWKIPDRDTRIQALAARYAALQAQGQDPEAYSARLAKVPRAPDPLPEPAVVWQKPLDLGQVWFGHLPRDGVLRIAADGATSGVSLMLWSAADGSERMTVHDSQKVQWTTRLGRGRMLLSDMGRPLAQIVDDTHNRNDALAGLGPVTRGDGTSRLHRQDARELFTLGALKLGLAPRDLHAALTLFAPVEVRPDQSLAWETGIDLTAGRADLQAAVDLLAVVVNMPHAMAPVDAPSGPARLTLWRDEAGAFAPMRALTPETERAFAAWRMP